MDSAANRLPAFSGGSELQLFSDEEDEDEEDGEEKKEHEQIRRCVCVTSECLSVFRTCSNRLHFLSNRKPHESSPFLRLLVPNCRKDLTSSTVKRCLILTVGISNNLLASVLQRANHSVGNVAHRSGGQTADEKDPWIPLEDQELVLSWCTSSWSSTKAMSIMQT